MGELLIFSGATILPLPVERILDAAKDCTAVLVLGDAEDGSFYAAASTGDGQALLWWVEQFKHRLLSGVYAGFEP